MKRSGIYIIKNITKCIYYVGEAENIDSRKQQHFASLCNGSHVTFLEMTRGKSPAKYELLLQLIYNPEHKHEAIYNSFYQVADYYSTLRRKGVNYED